MCIPGTCFYCSTVLLFTTNLRRPEKILWPRAHNTRIFIFFILAANNTMPDSYEIEYNIVFIEGTYWNPMNKKQRHQRLVTSFTPTVYVRQYVENWSQYIFASHYNAKWCEAASKLLYVPHVTSIGSYNHGSSRVLLHHSHVLVQELLDQGRR
jgi:hypothetical protein